MGVLGFIPAANEVRQYALFTHSVVVTPSLKSFFTDICFIEEVHGEG